MILNYKMRRTTSCAFDVLYIMVKECINSDPGLIIFRFSPDIRRIYKVVLIIAFGPTLVTPLEALCLCLLPTRRIPVI